MRAWELHPWDLSFAEAQAVQVRLARLVESRARIAEVRRVAGVDVSTGRGGPARGAVVVLDYPGMRTVEVATAERVPEFPYVPGFLSFRESPVILACFEKLTQWPDLVFVDGQGLAHPRRFGFACHLGLLLDRPTIGCAKSRLVGEWDPVGESVGDWSPLTDRDEVVGAVLRTRRGVKPLFVSIGHRVDLATAVDWTQRCAGPFRLPEPTRRAHWAAAGQTV